jgi:transposase
MLIVALDLGLSKSAVCVLDTETGEVREETCRTDAEHLRKLFEQTQPDLVVVEICPLAAWVHDVAVAAGLRIQVADTTQDAWKWRNVKRKTDRDDALKLARLAALGQINPVHIPSRRMRQWRELVEYRAALVAERTRIKNRVRQLVRVHAGTRLPMGQRGWTQTVRERLVALAQPLGACRPEALWRGVLASELVRLAHTEDQVRQVEARLDRLGLADARVRLVRTLPGVGPRVAEVIVTSLDQAERFASRRQVAAYGGLTPRRYQSGRMDRSGRISKRGRPLLRQLLAQAAWQAVWRDARFRAFFERVSHGSRGRRKIAIVAVMRQLLVIAWAMLRDRQPYRPAVVARAA